MPAIASSRTAYPRPFARPNVPRSGPPPQSNVPPRGNRPATAAGGKPEHEILFQQFFKSVGPRTYAAQVKKAGNGNHYVVITEGQRDDKSGDVRKTRLFVFSEDFEQFFGLLRKTGEFVKANPLPPEIRRKRERFWAKQAAGANTPSGKPRGAFPARPGAARATVGR